LHLLFFRHATGEQLLELQLLFFEQFLLPLAVFRVEPPLLSAMVNLRAMPNLPRYLSHFHRISSQNRRPLNLFQLQQRVRTP
jgi:hypothetical protein